MIRLNTGPYIQMYHYFELVRLYQSKYTKSSRSCLATREKILSRPSSFCFISLMKQLSTTLLPSLRNRHSQSMSGTCFIRKMQSILIISYIPLSPLPLVLITFVLSANHLLPSPKTSNFLNWTSLRRKEKPSKLKNSWVAIDTHRQWKWEGTA